MRTLAALLAGGLVACGGNEPEREVRLDLLEHYPFTAQGSAASDLDLGTPEGDAHLLRGWLRGATLASGESAALARPPDSELWLTLPEPAERRLALRCLRQGGRADRPARLVVRLNGRRLGVVSLRGELEEHRLRLPLGVQRIGLNVLSLEHRGQRRNPEAPPRASLGQVACERIRVERPGTIEKARPRLVQGAAPGEFLLVPGGASVEYFARVPAGAGLRLALSPDEEGREAKLRVELTSEGDPRVETVEVRAAAMPRERTLPVASPSGRLAKVVLANPGPDAVRVLRAQLLDAPPPRAPTSTGAVERAGTRRPHVLLYLIDTLRADHLGCYGYAPRTSPHLDALAHEGVLFERAIAQASWTRAATASILTGLLPLSHGATRLSTGIHPEVPTLAEILERGGYRTGAFVTNVNVSEPWGFARGFETFEYLPEEPERPTLHVTSSELNARVFPWLAVADERPFFLYVHASDPHAPYRPPDAPPGDERLRRFQPERDEASAEDVPELVSLYDGEIAANDRSLGALLGELRRLGVYEDTIVLVTSDHGEEFHDHGRFGHAHTLFEELIRVPLVLRLPRGELAGARVGTVAQQVDLAPTMLALAGLAPPPGLPGSPLVRRGSDGAVVLAEASRDVEVLSHTYVYRELASLSTLDWKLVQGGGRGPLQRRLFDLRSDAVEQSDASHERPLLRAYAEQSLRAHLASAWGAAPSTGSDAKPIDPRTRERLRALGYVLDEEPAR